MSSTPDRNTLQKISSLGRRRRALLDDIAGYEAATKSSREKLDQVEREVAVLLASLDLADPPKERR